MATGIPRLIMPASLLFVAAAFTISCAGAVADRPRGGGKPVGVRLGQEFKLRAGGRAAVEGEGLKVRFDSVTSDSRCPEGVTCVWAGNAEVLIEAEAGGGPAVIRLNTHGGDNYPKERRHRQYAVGLVGLSPHPARGIETKATDYEVTLVIRKV
jgi:hypothetical protein